MDQPPQAIWSALVAFADLREWSRNGPPVWKIAAADVKASS
jgi:hypothetical protein